MEVKEFNMNKTLGYSIFSVFIPLAAYLFFFLVAAIVPPDVRGYFPILLCNVFGLALSVIALSRSNPRPTDTSFTIRMVVLFGNIGLLANTIAVESILSIALFAVH